VNPSNLISYSHSERMARAAEKRRRLLAFLRSEVYTTVDVAAAVMQLRDRYSATKTLAALQRGGCIVVDKIALPLGGHVTVVGITLDGQAAVAELLQKPFIGAAYERGRVGLTTLDHRTDLQRLRLACARAGWREWKYSDRVSAAEKSVKDVHRPDAISTTPSGVRVALEVERTLKSKKRYRFILGRHLEAIQRSEYQHVIYTSPDAARADALRAIVHGLGHVVTRGRDVAVSPDLFSPFCFCVYDQITKLEL
jgi:hypothetical protein